MTNIEPAQFPRCVVALDGRFVEHYSGDIKAEIILKTNIADLILSPGGWGAIVSSVQKHGKVTLAYAFRKPGVKGVWHGEAEWELRGDRFYGVMVRQFDVTTAWEDGGYTVAPIKVVSEITRNTDKNTDTFMKVGQNNSNKLSVPDAPETMTLHKAFHLIAQNAFRSLPLLAHKEILEVCDFEATDKIRISCPTREDAIALHEGRWDIAECASWLYPQNTFELYIQDKDQPQQLYKTFSTKEALTAGRLQRREVKAMIDQGQGIGNGHNSNLILQPDLSFREIYNSVMFSDGIMTLVTNTEQKPIIVSNAYAALTNDTVSHWVGAGSLNKAGWAPGELDRMLLHLERDGYLHNFEYRAYLDDYAEETIWYASFQRIFCDKESMRVVKVLDIQKTNLVSV